MVSRSPADGQERDVRAVEFSDQLHVAEKGRVPGVVELESALELDQVAERFTAVDHAPVIEGDGGAVHGMRGCDLDAAATPRCRPS